ncbi:Microtubule-associated protein RP/EB member 2 [Balamuthia mandrillaris]
MATNATRNGIPVLFIGRKALLDWLNGFLELNYTKVEQTASAAAHCQLMDAIHPGAVPLHKVNFDAEFEYEFVANFKVLQEVFKKLGVKKFIDVPTLVKAKYMDNLEFFQWMKCYFDQNYCSSEPYPALERRQKAMVLRSKHLSTTSGALRVERKTSSLDSSSNPVRSAKENQRPAVMNTTNIKKANKATAPSGEARAVPTSAKKAKRVPVSKSSSLDGQKKSKPARNIKTSERSKKTETTVLTNNFQLEELQRTVENLTDEIAGLKLVVDNLESERDFYFSKLRDVEIKCQENVDLSYNFPLPEFIQQVLDILYAEDEGHTQERGAKALHSHAKVPQSAKEKQSVDLDVSCPNNVALSVSSAQEELNLSSDFLEVDTTSFQMDNWLD